jgi:acetyltransferase-like isoleucine patch superfamily enzyme
MSDRTRTIALIGNCQVALMGDLIASFAPQAQLRVLDFSTPEARDPETQARFADRLGEVDIVLMQHNVQGAVSTETVRAVHGDRTLVVANFYWRGYHPDFCYVGPRDDRVFGLTGFHSYPAVHAFLEGRTVQDALDDYSPEGFARLGLDAAWDQSIDEMRARDGHISIPITDTVLERVRRRSCFHTPNHPSVDLVWAHLRDVLNLAGIPAPEAAPAIADPFSTLGCPPVHEFVARQHGIKFRPRKTWRVAGRRMDHAEVIAACFRTYERMGLTWTNTRISSPAPLTRLLEKAERQYSASHEAMAPRDGRALNNRYRFIGDGRGVNLDIADDCNVRNLAIEVRGEGNRLTIGPGCRIAGHIFLADGASVEMGAGTTALRVLIHAHEGGRVEIGEDCMISSEVVFRPADAHPFYDMVTGERLNPPRPIVVGDHVWLGERAYLTSGSGVGAGSIVGAGSTVTKRLRASNMVLVGSPARIVRRGVVWKREHASGVSRDFDVGGGRDVDGGRVVGPDDAVAA